MGKANFSAVLHGRCLLWIDREGFSLVPPDAPLEKSKTVGRRRQQARKFFVRRRNFSFGSSYRAGEGALRHNAKHSQFCDIPTRPPCRGDPLHRVAHELRTGQRSRLSRRAMIRPGDEKPGLTGPPPPALAVSSAARSSKIPLLFRLR